MHMEFASYYITMIHPRFWFIDPNSKQYFNRRTINIFVLNKRLFLVLFLRNRKKLTSKSNSKDHSMPGLSLLLTLTIKLI